MNFFSYKDARKLVTLRMAEEGKSHPTRRVLLDSVDAIMVELGYLSSKTKVNSEDRRMSAAQVVGELSLHGMLVQDRDEHVLTITEKGREALRLLEAKADMAGGKTVRHARKCV